MSAIDHAAIRIEAPPAGFRRLQPPPPWRVAVAFALLQVPLTLIAIAFEWRTTWGTPDEVGPILLDFLTYGSAVSGPLAPQVVLLILAVLARRRGVAHIIGSAGIGLVGLLVTFNGVMEALSDPAWTPQPVHLVSGTMFVALGLALTASAIRELTRNRTR